MNVFRNMARVCTTTAIFIVLLSGVAAEGQALSVLPVNILLPPNQKAASLTVTNRGTSETAVQIRVFGWSQGDGEDKLTTSDAVLASPPIATIAPGASQVVRLVLRQLPQEKEATYRLLVDEIPPPSEPGVVHVVLRLSIPIFAEPATRALARVQFHLERVADRIVLVGTNDGLRHESIRNIVLTTADGRALKPAQGTLPYILSGATRRWNIAVEGSLPLPSETLQLTAHSDSGDINQQVSVISAP